MDNLITKQAMLKHIEKKRQDAQTMDDIHRMSIIMTGMDLLEEAVRNQPSVQPTNKGLWVKQELAPQTLRFCSLCGCKKPRGVMGNFCPNCEAKMDGRKAEYGEIYWREDNE